MLFAVAALRGDSGVDSRRRRDGDDAMSAAEPTFFRMDLFFTTASMLGETWELFDRAVWDVVACFEVGRKRRSLNAELVAGDGLATAAMR